MDLKVILLWLDAFSNRFVTESISPTLAMAKQDGYLDFLEPMFAYQGIWYSLATSTPISDHGVWSEHVINKEGAPLSPCLETILRLSEHVPHDYSAKVFRFIGYKLCGRDYGTPHLIPAPLVRYFEIRKPPPNLKMFPEILSENGVKQITIQPKLSMMERSVMSKIVRTLHTHDFMFMKLNSLDRLGHKLGPTSHETLERVRYLDGLVNSLMNSIKNSNLKILLVLMSDHGMTPVSKTLDLQRGLRQLPIEMGKDYQLFCGATYASFWFENDKTRRIVSSFLQEQPGVKLLDNEDKVKLGLGNLPEEFGELIAVNEDGQVFFPDFYWRRHPAKGMHGFAFNSYDNPIIGFYSNIIDARIEDNLKRPRFIDIAPTILKFLNIPRPEYFQGRNLLRS